MAVVHVEKLRVNWIDTDASGRIHYTAALRWFEIAEHALMRRIYDEVEFGVAGEREFGFPRVHVESDYRLALRYPDEISCSARVDRVGRSSVTYVFEVKNAQGEVAITGKIVAAAAGPDGRSIPLPDAFRAKLEASL